MIMVVPLYWFAGSIQDGRRRDGNLPPGDRCRGKSGSGKSGSDPISALREIEAEGNRGQTPFLLFEGNRGQTPFPDPVSALRESGPDLIRAPEERGRGETGSGPFPLSDAARKTEKDPISLRREPRTRTCRSACVVRATGRDGNALAALIRS